MQRTRKEIFQEWEKLLAALSVLALLLSLGFFAARMSREVASTVLQQAAPPLKSLFPLDQAFAFRESPPAEENPAHPFQCRLPFKPKPIPAANPQPKTKPAKAEKPAKPEKLPAEAPPPEPRILSGNFSYQGCIQLAKGQAALLEEGKSKKRHFVSVGQNLGKIRILEFDLNRIKIMDAQGAECEIPFSGNRDIVVEVVNPEGISDR